MIANESGVVSPNIVTSHYLQMKTWQLCSMRQEMMDGGMDKPSNFDPGRIMLHSDQQLLNDLC